jgi:hypothetical protein
LTAGVAPRIVVETHPGGAVSHLVHHVAKGSYQPEGTHSAREVPCLIAQDPGTSSPGRMFLVVVMALLKTTGNLDILAGK